jgi:hypothetical protein
MAAKITAKICLVGVFLIEKKVPMNTPSQKKVLVLTA